MVCLHDIVRLEYVWLYILRYKMRLNRHKLTAVLFCGLNIYVIIFQS